MRPSSIYLGWHYDCLDPPLDGPPEGNWNCPLCPPLPEEDDQTHDEDEEAEVELEESGVDEVGEDEEEDEVPAMVTEDETTSKPTVTPKRKKSRPKSRSRPSTSHRTPASSRKARPSQRTPARTNHKAPGGPATQQRVTFRLRLGSGRNQKNASDEEKKSQFETFLAPEDYDTSKSAIMLDDKGRYDKSRIAAEVGHHFLLPLPIICAMTYSTTPLRII